MQKITLTSLFSLLIFTLKAQSTYVPLNADYYHLLDRYEIKLGKFNDGMQASFKPFTRKTAVLIAEKTLYTDSLNLFDNYSDRDVFNLQNIIADNWEWSRSEYSKVAFSTKTPINNLYKRKADTYSFQSKEHDLHVSPIFNFSGGFETNSKTNTFINTRGIEIRGTINNKVGFYTQFTENQVLGQTNVKDYINYYNAFPGESFVKINRDKTKNLLLSDFISARGYITFNPVKAIQLQFGHDKNFIGAGSQSILLSDASAPYLFLKAQTSIGRLQYTNIFAQLINTQQDPKLINAGSQGVIPPKYMAVHRLGINFTNNFNMGFFEAISFGKRRVGFDPNYLNPAIFYRFVEGHLGSPDNSMIGLDAKLNLKRHVSIYGQLLVDEFKLDSLKKSKGWRANKVGYQFGFKYIDAFNIKNLDFQFEHNRVRPYTFQHFSTYSSYVHYNQPIGHSYGANFTQSMFILRYQPSKRFSLTTTAMLSDRGLDTDKNNWGGNILRNYENYPREFGNFIGQGQLLNTNYLEINGSFMILHNLFVDATITNRNMDSADNAKDLKNLGFQIGLRLNTARRQFIY